MDFRLLLLSPWRDGYMGGGLLGQNGREGLFLMIGIELDVDSGVDIQLYTSSKWSMTSEYPETAKGSSSRALEIQGTATIRKRVSWNIQTENAKCSNICIFIELNI